MSRRILLYLFIVALIAAFLFAMFLWNKRLEIQREEATHVLERGASLEKARELYLKRQLIASLEEYKLWVMQNPDASEGDFHSATNMIRLRHMALMGEVSSLYPFYEEAYEKHHNPRYLKALWLVCLQTDRDYEKSLQIAERTLRDHPAYPKGGAMFASSYFAVGNPAAAERVIADAIDQGASTDELYTRIAVYLGDVKGHPFWDMGIGLFQRALAENPANVNARINLAGRLRSTGRFEEAERECLDVINNYGEYTSRFGKRAVHRELLQLYYESERYKEAVSAYQQLKRHVGEKVSPIYTLMYLRSLYNLKECDEMEAILEGSKEPLLLHDVHYGLLEYVKGDKDTAIQKMEIGIAEIGVDYWAEEILGDIYFEQQRYNEALKHWLSVYVCGNVIYEMPLTLKEYVPYKRKEKLKEKLVRLYGRLEKAFDEARLCDDMVEAFFVFPTNCTGGTVRGEAESPIDAFTSYKNLLREYTSPPELQTLCVDERTISVFTEHKNLFGNIARLDPLGPKLVRRGNCALIYFLPDSVGYPDIYLTHVFYFLRLGEDGKWRFDVKPTLKCKTLREWQGLRWHFACSVGKNLIGSL